MLGFPQSSRLLRTSSAECFPLWSSRLAPSLPAPAHGHPPKLVEEAPLSQGTGFPGLRAARGGPPKPWDSVQVTKILSLPPNVCPSSGKCKFYYQ